jgi:anti-sigma-K factor RskA
MGCGLKKSLAEELIVGYAARTLDAEAQAEFERHLQSCANCRELAARQCEVWSALEEWHPPAASPEFEQNLANRIRAGKRDGTWARRLGISSWRPLIPAAAACAVLLVAFLLKYNSRASAPASGTEPQTRIEQQVEHELDDLDMLKQIGMEVSSTKAGSPRKI